MTITVVTRLMRGGKIIAFLIQSLARNQNFVKKRRKPNVHIFRLKNVSLGPRAELTSAT